jgi:RimJ/RimL family protein N-acetyltransferase
VTVPGAWPRADPIGSERLILEPLRVGHAAEMAPVLDDADLHTFIGGRPATVEELRDRYAAQALGQSPDGRQGWLNWILRLRGTGEPVGTVQATLTRDPAGAAVVAELAWVVAVNHQRRGYAREAATALAGWLREHGVATLIAHITPAHRAAVAVATRLGMHATGVTVDGETRWTT